MKKKYFKLLRLFFYFLYEYLKERKPVTIDCFIQDEYKKTLFYLNDENTKEIVSNETEKFMINGDTVLFKKPFTPKFYRLIHTLARQNKKEIMITY